MSADGNGWYPAQVRFFPSVEAPIFIRNLNEGRTIPVDYLEGRLFASLRGCLPIDEHLAALAARESSIARAIGFEKLKGILQSWQAEGFLRPDTLLKPDLEQPTTEYVLSTSSAERPKALAAWLSAFGASGLAAESISVAIVDDSRSEENIRANQETLANAANDSAGSPNPSLRYVSREVRSKWCDRLADRLKSVGIGKRVIEWAFLSSGVAPLGVSTLGAARNTQLSLAPDSKIVSADDDILPHWATFEDTDWTLTVVGPADYTARVYPSIKALEMERRNCHFDATGIVSLLASLDARLSRYDLTMTPSEVARLWEDQPPRVIAASVGVFGARQFAEPLRAIIHDEEIEPWYAENFALFESIQRWGLTARHTLQPTITKRESLSSALWAIDSRADLPPFFPWGRRQDDCFALLSGRVWPESLSAELPVAVLHNPEHKRPFEQKEVGTYVIDTGFFNYATLLLFAKNFVSSDPRMRLEEVSRKYGEIGHLSPRCFREFLWELVRQHLNARVREIEDILEASAAPNTVRAARHVALAAYRNYMITSLQEPDNVVPREFRELLRVGYFDSVDSALKELQCYYTLWSDLLAAWPTIRRAAREVGGVLSLIEE